MLKAESSPPDGMAPRASIQRTRSLVKDTAVVPCTCSTLPLLLCSICCGPGGTRPKVEEAFHRSQSKPAGVSHVIGNVSSESAVSICLEASALSADRHWRVSAAVTLAAEAVECREAPAEMLLADARGVASLNTKLSIEPVKVCRDIVQAVMLAVSVDQPDVLLLAK